MPIHSQSNLTNLLNELNESCRVIHVINKLYSYQVILT